MRNLYRNTWIIAALILLGVSMADAALFDGYCWSLSHGTPCINWTGSQYEFTGTVPAGTLTMAAVEAALGNYSANAPYLLRNNTAARFTFVTVDTNMTVGDTTGQILLGNGGGISWNVTDTCMISPANSTYSRSIYCVTKPTG
jgi:hypothetical protein